LTAEDPPDSSDQLRPTVFFRQFQDLFQLRHQIAIVTGSNHSMNQTGVGEQDLLVLFRNSGHRRVFRGFDECGKYTTLASV
jgi:hypothetical protein